LLEDWPAGGVEISDRAVGLFLDGVHERGSALDEALAGYGLVRASFGLKELLRIGFSTEWTWTGIRWAKGDNQVEAGLLGRLHRTLGPGLHEDRQRQILLLKQVQAASKRLGDPSLVEGFIVRPGARTERVLVYASGIVAYDRTPHPLSFLREIAQSAR